MWDFKDELFDRLEAVEALAAELNVPPAQYALAWALAQPAMTSMIVGAKRVGQIEDALGALEVTIPEAHMKRLHEVCPPPWSQWDPIRG